MGERRRIGELLLEAGVITADQLDGALAEQRRSGGRLCYNLIRLGHLRAEELVDFLGEQFGVAAVDLERYRVPEPVLRLLPAEFAHERRIVPLNVLGNSLTVALADPSRADDIAAVRELTGLEPEPVICPEASLEAALRRFYPGAGPTVYGEAERVFDLDEQRESAQPAGASAGARAAEDWLRGVLLQALRRRSREIHLEPTAEGLRPRFRVRGVLEESEPAPAGLAREIVLRARSLAGLAPAGPGAAPAEGRFRIRVRNRLLRATLSTFPTIHGKRLVVQIVDESLLAREFQELGMAKPVADEVQRLLASRNGVLLISAPPGQGRHTTFYSFLSYLRGEGGRNIMTLESPVRLPVAGISQSQVGGGAALGFASGLQAILHQEPDVVGVTDVPDRAALEMVFAAGRRSLVVALVDQRDTRRTLAWLLDAGVSAASQGQLLRGVLAQLLLPKICSACREPLGEPVQLLEGVRGRRVEELAFYTGGGCEQCGGSGRAGRLALFELLTFREGLRELLQQGEPAQLLVEEAQRRGMWTLREDGVHKASQGLADIRDVLEATAPEGTYPT